MKAIVSIDQKAPAPKQLESFLQSGGLLIIPPSAAHLTDGLPAAGKHETGYKLYQAGTGTIAVSPSPWNDPYQVTADAHRMLSRKHDVVRLWNAGSSITYPVTSNGKTIVHLLNYTGRQFGQDCPRLLEGPPENETLSITSG